MRARRIRSAWGALVAGVASVATLPVAVYLTRFSARYELLHAGLAIPLGGGLGLAALALSGRIRRLSALRVDRRAATLARLAWLLGLAGVCLALAGVVALLVYALLEYAGTRD